MSATQIWDNAADQLRRGLSWWGGELRQLFALDRVSFSLFAPKVMRLTQGAFGWELTAPKSAPDSAPLRLVFDESGNLENAAALKALCGGIKTLTVALRCFGADGGSALGGGVEFTPGLNVAIGPAHAVAVRYGPLGL